MTLSVAVVTVTEDDVSRTVVAFSVGWDVASATLLVICSVAVTEEVVSMTLSVAVVPIIEDDVSRTVVAFSVG